MAPHNDRSHKDHRAATDSCSHALLQQIPVEVARHVACYLAPRDAVSWSRSCRAVHSKLTLKPLLPERTILNYIHYRTSCWGLLPTNIRIPFAVKRHRIHSITLRGYWHDQNYGTIRAKAWIVGWPASSRKKRHHLYAFDGGAYHAVSSAELPLIPNTDYLTQEYGATIVAEARLCSHDSLQPIRLSFLPNQAQYQDLVYFNVWIQVGGDGYNLSLYECTFQTLLFDDEVPSSSYEQKHQQQEQLVRVVSSPIPLPSSLSLLTECFKLLTNMRILPPKGRRHIDHINLEHLQLNANTTAGMCGPSAASSPRGLLHSIQELRYQLFALHSSSTVTSSTINKGDSNSQNDSTSYGCVIPHYLQANRIPLTQAALLALEEILVCHIHEQSLLEQDQTAANAAPFDYYNRNVSFHFNNNSNEQQQQQQYTTTANTTEQPQHNTTTPSPNLIHYIYNSTTTTTTIPHHSTLLNQHNSNTSTSNRSLGSNHSSEQHQPHHHNNNAVTPLHEGQRQQLHSATTFEDSNIPVLGSKHHRRRSWWHRLRCRNASTTT